MSVAAPEEERELTEEEQQAARAKKCKEIEDRILAAKYNVNVDVWELAKALYEFNEENGWTALGCDTQAEWLAKPEVSMKKATFSRIVRRYKEFVVERQLPVVRTEDVPDSQVVLAELDPTKLDLVLTAVEKGTVSLQKALNDAEALGWRDLRIEYGKEEEPPLPPTSSVINGTGTRVDGDGEPTEEEKAAAKLLEQLTESAGHVDSWLEYGGDRRKVRRHMRRLIELHPVLVAVRLVEACVEDQPLEGHSAPPSKEDALGAWKELVPALRLPIPSAE